MQGVPPYGGRGSVAGRRLCRISAHLIDAEAEQESGRAAALRLGAPGAVATRAADGPRRPNLLFIMTDQHRWDALGCTGGWVRTPNLDRLAREGALFTNCVTDSPICMPARLCLATGLHCHNTGLWVNKKHSMSAQQGTWMKAVRAAGYRTSLWGKAHLYVDGPSVGRGDLTRNEALLHAYGLDDVDETDGPGGRTVSHMTRRWKELGLLRRWYEDLGGRSSGWGTEHLRVEARPSSLPLEEYYDVYVGRRAREYLRAYDRPEPWCCWVSFMGPHEPWDAPEPYASMYEPAAMPEPAPLAPWARELGRPAGYLNRRLRQWPQLAPGNAAALRANYAGSVTLIDDQIGEILGTIQARGELDNTAVVFCSDHGECNGDYGFVGKHVFLDGSVRIPLIVRTPETARGAGGIVSESPANLMDVGATLVDLAGGEMAHKHFAKSLLPTVRDPRVQHRPEAISEFIGEVMIMDERWKGVLNRDGKVYMLFDRSADPQEQENLAGRPAGAEAERVLRSRLLEHLLRTTGADHRTQ